MKYIKLFNESISQIDRDNKIKEIKSFCEMYLVDLTDKGCELTIEYATVVNVYTFRLDTKGLKWSMIKDSFLPFLEMLMKEYKIVSDVLFQSMVHRNEYERYPASDLLSGKIQSESPFKSIRKMVDDWNISRIIFDIDK